MKKRNKILPLVLMGLITLSGCNSSNGPVNPDINNNDKDDEHTHKHYFDLEWTYDENTHWHKALCGHDIKVNEAEHEYENGTCKVCGYHKIKEDITDKLKGYDYKIDDETDDIIFLGLKDNSITDIIIPDIFTVIGSSAFKNKTITSISIPSSITKIESYAFSNLTIECELIIPDSVTSIGDNCFSRTTFSIGLKIPNSVTSLGTSCFEKTVLPSITLSENLKEIPDYCFSSSSLKSIVLPDSIERIGKYAFGERAIINKNYTWLVYGEGNPLESITLSKNLKIVDDYAFLNCFDLKELILNEGLESIGEYAFARLHSIKEVSIPDSVTELKKYCFSHCINLVDTKLPSGLKILEEGLFSYCEKLGDFIVPEGVEIIREGSCGGKVYLPSTIKEIDSTLGNEIYYNGTLKDWYNVKIDDFYNPFKHASVRCMRDENGEYVDYAKVANIILPDEITELNSTFMSMFAKTEDGYHYNYDDIKSITIPKSVKKIKDRCIPCFTIYYEGTLKEWMEVEIPNSDIYYGNYADINLFVKENGEYVNSKTLDLPSDITEIKPYQFLRYRINSKLVIPSSIKVIGKYAFYDAKETNYVKITNPLVKIESEAFGWQSSRIQTLEIDNPDGVIMDIASDAFEYAFYTLNVIYNGSKESFEANTNLRKALKWFSSNTVNVTFPDGEKITL